MTTITELQKIAIEQITTYHECSICDYTASNKDYVIEHILKKHTEKELKEICAE